MLERTVSLLDVQYHKPTGITDRRYSLPTENSLSIIKKIKEIRHSSQILNRSDAIPDLHRYDQDGALSYTAKIEYNNVVSSSDLNSKDYVYCGMATAIPINNFGMSVDNEGNLILIKGDSYNLLRGLVNKYTSGYEYQVTQITNSGTNIKIENLYINEKGLLICDEKETGKSYIININIPAGRNAIDSQLVAINFIEYEKKEYSDFFNFEIDANTFISYFHDNNKLYLKSIQKGNKSIDYSMMDYEISIPLKKDAKIISIKRAEKCLQIETQKNNKKRIFYIDPKHISHKKLFAKKVSHKPPQNLSSRLGGDPHERYHAGQPFSSDRKANFSSKYIPLFSSIIDNFRINIKLAKVSVAEEKIAHGILYVAKAVDPGALGFYSTLSNITRIENKAIRNNIKTKKDMYSKNIDALKLHSDHLSKIVHDVWGIQCANNISESLSIIIKEIKPREAIHLIDSNGISAFFGIASGGTPFVSGWFFGVIAGLSITHTLTISKTEEHNIKLSFHNRSKLGVAGMAGTGQGLEKTLLGAGGVDYMTVLPVEANAILALQCVFNDNFSFELSAENFEKFVTQLTAEQQDAALEELIISEAETKKTRKTEFVVKLEAKCELRPEIGTMMNANTYMVVPRTAVGARLALDLLNITFTSEFTPNGDNEFSSSASNFRITALKPEMDIFAESKIMPIAMQPGEDNRLWCFPLPLQEESKALYSSGTVDGLVLYDKSTPVNKPTEPPHSRLTSININKVRSTRICITVNNKGRIKKGLSPGQTVMKLKDIDVFSETLSQLKKTLANQETASQNKACVMSAVSHYERVDGKPSTGDTVALTFEDLLSLDVPTTLDRHSSRSASSNITYRLKKLEFRKLSSSSKINATAPLSILNFSNVNNVTYDQYLGEIEFLYNLSSDTVPYDVEHRLTVLY